MGENSSAGLGRLTPPPEVFGRRPTQVGLLRLLSSSSEPIPAELEGETGTGPSFPLFLQVPYLSNDGTNYIPLNFLPDYFSLLSARKKSRMASKVNGGNSR